MPPRASVAGGFTAAGQELQRLSGLLLGLLQGREAREFRQREEERQRARLALEEARLALTREAEERRQREAEQERAERLADIQRQRAERGIVGSEFVPVPEIDRRDITPAAPRIGLAAGTTPQPTIRERLTAAIGSARLPRMPEQVLRPEHYDPARDVELQRATERERALQEIRAAFAQQQDEPVNWQVVQTDQGLVQVNPRTGETRSLGLRPPERPTTTGTGPRRLTEQQAKMRVAVVRAEQGLKQIEDFLGYDAATDTFREGGGRVPEESFLGRFTPGRYFQSPEVQAYDRAAEAVASAILRIESGAAITAQEIESYKRQFIPRPGDRPEVIRDKLQAIRATLERIREGAGLPPVDWQTRANELRAQGLSEDAIISRLREEGYIQ